MAAGNKLLAKEDRRGSGADIPFLILTLGLLALGLAVLYSASSAQSAYDTGYAITTRYLQKQAVCALLGLIALYLFSRVPAALWYRLAWPVYGVSILLLLSVLLVGQQVNGARRWISIAGLQFQPSEIAKFGAILVFARLTADFGEKSEDFLHGVLGFGGALLGILVPLALEKHLSAIMLMGYAGDRISAWRHPELDPGDTGYQILQSLYAIGSGGVLGLGFGKSRQKYLYLPFQYNDYIFAIFCEELGLLGALALMALFAALITRGYRIARLASDRFSSALAAGLTSLIAVQTILNLCVVTNLLPSTGIALPFFSYGGTALAVNLGEMGIVLSISRQKDSGLVSRRLSSGGKQN